ncbi:MAG: hypothetical protein AAB632_02420 [Patescibacteria group bacterium]
MKGETTKTTPLSLQYLYLRRTLDFYASDDEYGSQRFTTATLTGFCDYKLGKTKQYLQPDRAWQPLRDYISIA